MNSFLRFTALGLVLAAGASWAHVSVSADGAAGSTTEAVFSVTHGCDGADTAIIRVELPEGVTSVRPFDSVFGDAAVELDSTTQAVTAITWTRDPARVRPADTHAYRFRVRMKLPNTPFRYVYFPTVQTCRDGAGVETTVEWVSTTGGHDHHGGGGDGGTSAQQPAPSLLLMPNKLPGWNRFTVTEHLHDLPLVFRDAQIVWAGDAAFSFNPVVMELIQAEPDVAVLSEVHPGTEIWVKY